MSHSAEVLKNANDTIANAYRIKSGMSQETFLDLMDKETWMTAKQALENNLVDEIMFENSIALVNETELSGMLPQEVIEKMRNSKNNPAQKNEADIFTRKKSAATSKTKSIEIKRSEINMTIEQYNEQRQALLNAIEGHINEGDLEASAAKMKEVEDLDNKWEQVKLANANLNALKDNNKVTNIQNKGGGSIERNNHRFHKQRI